MELLIFSGLAAVGNFLNTQKQPRRSKTSNSTVSGNDVPSGDLIVEKGMGQMVDDYILRRASKTHEARMQQEFPDTVGGTVVPSASNDLGGWPAPLGVLENTLEKDVAFKYDESLSQIPRTMAPLDPQTGQMQVKKSNEILTGPMFREFNFKGADDFIRAEEAQRMGIPISSLTGLPLDTTHANMQPHWTPGAHRNGISDEMAQSRLEAFTGIASDYSTYGPRQEVAATWNGPQAQRPAAIVEATDSLERAISELGIAKTATAHLRPEGSEQRVARMAPNSVELRQKTMNELYPSLRIEETAGRYTMAKARGGRAEAPRVIYRKSPLNPDAREAVGNRAIVTSYPVQLAPEVREGPATEVRRNAWIGGKVSLKRDQSNDLAHDAERNKADTTLLRRQEVYEPHWATPDNTRVGLNPVHGQLTVRGTDKDVNNKYINPADGGRGGRHREGFVADVTIKQTLDVSQHAGKYGITDREIGAYQDANVDAPMTMKAISSEAKYIAPGVRNKGFGIRQHGIQDFVTIKETLLHEYYGNPTSHVKRQTNNDASHETATNRTIETKYTMPVNIIRGSKERTCAEVALKDEINSARTEHGQVATAKRIECQDVTLRQENVADGKRMYGNPSVKRIDRPGIGLVNRVVVNNEAINSRLDPSTVITNDMFPFINKCSKTD